MLSSNSSRFSPILAALFLILALTKPAAAYVEPGSGALIWQMLVAGLLGAMFYFRRIGRWLAGQFGKEKRSDTSDQM